VGAGRNKSRRGEKSNPGLSVAPFTSAPLIPD